MTKVQVARALAIAIAIAGAIDPAVTTTRDVAPTIALLTGESPDAARLADRLARELDGPYRVVHGPSPDAAVTLVAGRELPDVALDAAGLGFAAVPTRGISARITAIDAPRRAMLEARVPIAITVAVTGGRGRRLDVRLMRGSIVVDHASREIDQDDVTVAVPLTFAAGAPGAAPLRAETSLSDTSAAAAADFAVDVVADRWRVLFADRRPSWMSTFVRRAIEQDPRFDVSFHTRTSSRGGTEAGSPPASLSDSEALAPFHAIVVGAPDALTAADRAGLQAYARRRGGAILLLIDRDPGSTLTGIVDVTEWRSERLPAPATVHRIEPGPLEVQASELFWPAVLPALSRPIAQQTPSAAGPPRVLLFDAPLGAGRVLLSGLADAWRYRGVGDDAPFARLWTTWLASAAAAAPPALEVTLDQTVAAPGGAIAVTAVVRDLLLADAVGTRTATISGSIEGALGAIPVRLWPEGRPGTFVGNVRAPVEPGAYRLRVSSGGQSADAPLFVQDGARQPQNDQTDLVELWAATRGGRTFTDASLDELAPAVAAGIVAESRPERWHPMRSVWWLAPFVLALGLEWHWRFRARP